MRANASDNDKVGAVKPVESRHGGDEGDERRGVDHARRLPGGDKVKGCRRGRLERRELVRVKLRGKERLWSLQERDELGVRARPSAAVLRPRRVHRLRFDFPFPHKFQPVRIFAVFQKA